MFVRETTNYQHQVHIRRATSPLANDQSISFNLRQGTVIKHLRDDLILGRHKDQHLTNFVDLTSFGALGAGVSRQHLYIVRGNHGQVLVGDLGSSNGTYLNEERLLPRELYPLDNGDVLRLGTLIVHVLFE